MNEHNKIYLHIQYICKEKQVIKIIISEHLHLNKKININKNIENIVKKKVV